MASSISRSEKRGNFFPLEVCEGLFGCIVYVGLVVSKFSLTASLNSVMISSPCKQDEEVERLCRYTKLCNI